MNDLRSRVLAMETRRVNAMMAADVPALDELLASTVIWVHASSEEDSRETFLKGFQDGRLQAEHLVLSNQTVLVHRDVGICHGTVDMTARFGGVEKTSRNRYTTIWVDDGGLLRLALYQSTLMPSWSGRAASAFQQPAHGYMNFCTDSRFLA